MSLDTLTQYCDVSRETGERLKIYAAMLKKWNRAINLVAKPTLEALWSRHFLDSAQLFMQAPETTKSWADLGSGGGFPGLVVAILAAEKRPDLYVTLIESDQRKAVFLREVSRETQISVQVLAKRIEQIDQQFDIISARALAALPQLLKWSMPLLKDDGSALFLKGKNVEGEIFEARQNWQMHVTKQPSIVDSQGVVLKISALSSKSTQDTQAETGETPK